MGGSLLNTAIRWCRPSLQFSKLGRGTVRHDHDQSERGAGRIFPLLFPFSTAASMKYASFNKIMRQMYMMYLSERRLPAPFPNLTSAR